MTDLYFNLNYTNTRFNTMNPKFRFNKVVAHEIESSQKKVADNEYFVCDEDGNFYLEDSLSNEDTKTDDKKTDSKKEADPPGLESKIEKLKKTKLELERKNRKSKKMYKALVISSQKESLTKNERIRFLEQSVKKLERSYMDLTKKNSKLESALGRMKGMSLEDATMASHSKFLIRFTNQMMEHKENMKDKFNRILRQKENFNMRVAEEKNRVIFKFGYIMNLFRKINNTVLIDLNEQEKASREIKNFIEAALNRDPKKPLDKHVGMSIKNKLYNMIQRKNEAQNMVKTGIRFITNSIDFRYEKTPVKELLANSKKLKELAKFMVSSFGTAEKRLSKKLSELQNKTEYFEKKANRHKIKLKLSKIKLQRKLEKLNKKNQLLLSNCAKYYKNVNTSLKELNYHKDESFPTLIIKCTKCKTQKVATLIHILINKKINCVLCNSTNLKLAGTTIEKNNKTTQKTVVPAKKKTVKKKTITKKRSSTRGNPAKTRAAKRTNSVADAFVSSSYSRRVKRKTRRNASFAAENQTVVSLIKEEQPEVEAPVLPKEAKEITEVFTEENSSDDEDVCVKIENVNIYSKKYRMYAFKNLDPFPEKEFKALYKEFLCSHKTVVERRTRAGSSYSKTSHSDIVISKFKHPNLQKILRRLLENVEKNRVAILIYLRVFCKWLTNASGDLQPWNEPSKISSLEVFDIVAKEKTETRKIQDLTALPEGGNL